MNNSRETSVASAEDFARTLLSQLASGGDADPALLKALVDRATSSHPAIAAEASRDFFVELIEPLCDAFDRNRLRSMYACLRRPWSRSFPVRRPLADGTLCAHSRASTLRRLTPPCLCAQPRHVGSGHCCFERGDRCGEAKISGEQTSVFSHRRRMRSCLLPTSEYTARLALQPVGPAAASPGGFATASQIRGRCGHACYRP